ncbi:MFS transporter [Streptomyces sp. NPDC052114]|uniref:MFS transporter n=1 Tax=unclassified Streptomyces TaxID=2593676 RepID=UPI00341BCD7C
MYLAVLRTPHALRTFSTALVARLSYGTVSLSLMLAVKDATGSYAVAGTVAALFGATSVFLSPVRAALVDRHGPRRVLAPMVSAYAALLTVLAVVTWRPGTAPAVLGVLAALAGSCTPPLGPVMRTVWAELLDGDRESLQRAYSLDGVAEELLFVSGPLLVGLIVGIGPAAAGIALSAALIWGGTLAFLASPAVRGRRAGSRAGSRAGGKGTGTRRGAWRGLRQPVAAVAGVGLCLGALDLLFVAFAEDAGRPEAVAWVLAALSVGSAAGGLLHGGITWRSSARTRLPVLAVGLGATTLVAGLAPGLLALAVAAACAGVFVAPALTTAYLIADESVAPASRTQAGAWVNTAVNAGLSGGTAAAGVLVGKVPLAWCFAGAALAPVLGALAGLRSAARAEGGVGDAALAGGAGEGTGVAVAQRASGAVAQSSEPSSS